MDEEAMSPNDFGWNHTEEGIYEPIWFTGPQIPHFGNRKPQDTQPPARKRTRKQRNLDPKQASVKSHAPSSRAIIRHILENCGEDINDTEAILLSDISTTDSEWDMFREGQSSDESGDLWEP